MQSGLGAVVLLEEAIRPSALLFGESTGRAIVSFAPSREPSVRAAAAEGGVSFRKIGQVGGERVRIAVAGGPVIDEAVAELKELWSGAFTRAIESAAEVL
jgi:phosphoribosylformylglycinamidine synthase